MLKISKLAAGYGDQRIVEGVTLRVQAEEIVAVAGHNGAGKTTLLKAIFGLVRLFDGGIEVCGEVVSRPTPRRMIRLGVVHVPQGGRVFPNLTAEEHFEVMRRGGGSLRPFQRVLNMEIVEELFPDVLKRGRQRAGSLSGGERQMLGISVALSTDPLVLLLDEPFLGLTDSLGTEIREKLGIVVRSRKIAVLLVEHRVEMLRGLASRVLFMRRGRVAHRLEAGDLDNEELLRAVLG